MFHVQCCFILVLCGFQLVEGQGGCSPSQVRLKKVYNKEIHNSLLQRLNISNLSKYHVKIAIYVIPNYFNNSIFLIVSHPLKKILH